MALLFWMATSPFSYVTHPVDAALRRWIRGAWEFSAGPDAPGEHHVPPDGTASLVLLVEGVAKPRMTCKGPHVTPMVVPTRPGTVFRGLRLAAEAAPLLLGIEGPALIPGPVAVERFGPIDTAALADALSHSSAAAIATSVNALLSPSLAAMPELDSVVVETLSLIRDSGGRMTLVEVADRVGVSNRTLLRRVKLATGLTPKQHVRISRFYATAVGMLDPDHRLGTLAARGGYADQPHFNHEVSALTGLTPAELAGRVRLTSHQLDG